MARFSLSLLDRDAYDRDGFAVVRGLFSADEIAELGREADRLLVERTDLIDPDNIRCRWSDDCNSGQCRFDCFDPVIDLSEAYARMARDSRLLEIAAAIYEEPAHLFKDKLIYKPPGAKGYALHQDYIGWESFPESFLTIMVAIDPADARAGATEVFPGCHKQGCLTPRDGMYHPLPEDKIDLSTGVVLDLRPGDAGVFSGYTPHRSAANQSAHSRRVLYLSYNAQSDGGERRDAHYAEFIGWLKDRYAEYGKLNTFFR